MVITSNASIFVPWNYTVKELKEALSEIPDDAQVNVAVQVASTPAHTVKKIIFTWHTITP